MRLPGSVSFAFLALCLFALASCPLPSSGDYWPKTLRILPEEREEITIKNSSRYMEYDEDDLKSLPCDCLRALMRVRFYPDSVHKRTPLDVYEAAWDACPTLRKVE